MKLLGGCCVLVEVGNRTIQLKNQWNKHYRSGEKAMAFLQVTLTSLAGNLSSINSSVADDHRQDPLRGEIIKLTLKYYYFFIENFKF